MNFSTGIYSFFDTFDIHVVMEIIGIVTIVLISVAIVEAVPVVISNMQALAYYIRNFGIVQGCGMYMTLGAEGLPNGVISWLQADMADGDSSLDDFVEKGGADNSNKLALGLSDYLDDFASKNNAHTYKNFADPYNWKQGVNDALFNPNMKIIVNLDGVDNPLLAAQRAATNRGGATDWELLQIKLTPSAWDRITWYLNGEIVPNPFK